MALRNPFPGKWMLAPQRLGTEGLDRYVGSWVIDLNGFVSATATNELLPVTVGLPSPESAAR